MPFGAKSNKYNRRWKYTDELTLLVGKRLGTPGECRRTEFESG
jgi:hypothetical protein